MVTGPISAFSDAEAWRDWILQHQDDEDGIWLKISKKGAVVSTVSYSQALDVALCFGWIDGQKASLDAEHYLQRFTPRRARSMWSKINCAKVEALIEEGAMTARCLAEIDKAKADGRWDAAYAGQRTATVPDDFQTALDANPAAAE